MCDGKVALLWCVSGRVVDWVEKRERERERETCWGGGEHIIQNVKRIASLPAALPHTLWDKDYFSVHHFGTSSSRGTEFSTWEIPNHVAVIRFTNFALKALLLSSAGCGH